jgi:DNA invertase Pin-like site-specific DNA recombinase
VSFKQPAARRFFSEQVSSMAGSQQLEAALDYVREGDSFTVTKSDRLALSEGDLLAIIARLEAKRVSLRVLAMNAGRDRRPPGQPCCVAR